jgi:hypothetical protein
MTEHRRNTQKHEYEIQASQTGGMVFVGNRESTAVHQANEVLAEHLEFDSVRLYHTYPSPGPVRRYVGIIKRDGKLHRMYA